MECNSASTQENTPLLRPRTSGTTTASFGQAARTTLRADLNSDGVVDFVVVWNGKAQVTLFKADGTILSSAEYNVDPNAVNVVVGDFNGDGHPDLAVTDAWYDAEGGQVQILLNNGDGTFAREGRTGRQRAIRDRRGRL